ncbi:MAG: PDZ domain-containing protein [Phycisphaeraceae bacterium]|nr:PDZ domain-containing protein [Phycisphaeraceae bacterium]
MLILLCVSGSLAHATTYVVALDGSDANPGTLEKPFATLQRAQQAVRNTRGMAPVNVCLRAGTHYLPETLVFTAADSGTQTAPVVYQAYQEEQAVISGGAQLTELTWTPYRDGIMQAAVPAGLTTDQLFVNGQKLRMARYPNYNAQERIFNGYAADAIDASRVCQWADPTGGFLHAMHRHMWGDYHYRMTGKDADGMLQYVGGWQNNRQMGMHNRYRFVENIFEELDAPGEWFLDTHRNILYVYPPSGLDLANASIEAVRLRHLVEFRGSQDHPVQFLTLRNLVFRHAARTFMDNREPMVRSDWTTYRGGAVLLDGTEDCTLEKCWLDQVGGNAIFVNNYNRRVTIRACQIANAGANGVAFVGDPGAARNPLFEYGQRQAYAQIDKTPGPKTDNYPADCLVADCLIYRSGRVEKQTAPVQIELSQGITVRHCSIYDVPRAGINIGDGCWGGHVIEFCDVFDTVKETGDHGSFNSWGRDRFWHLTDLDLNDDAVWKAHTDLPLLDMVKPTILRNNRWRCDHGWDIDLDDGSSHYILTNNLCLKGGIKNREGFYRVVQNNIMVNNGFHPHVWYKHSQDQVRCNIMWDDHYRPAGGMPATAWGKVMDENIVHRVGVTEPQPVPKMREQSKRDTNTIMADALFINAAKGDFRVHDNSPALRLGFVNFPMDQFGVRSPALRKLARTPKIPALIQAQGPGETQAPAPKARFFCQARVRNIAGLGDRSAYGLPTESGVLVLNVPEKSDAAKAGLKPDDVILACNGTSVRTIADLLTLQNQRAGRRLAVQVQRKQARLSLEVAHTAYVSVECQMNTNFNGIAPGPASSLTVTASEPGTLNEPLDILTDGRLARNYGSVFGNGVVNGLYKMDLGVVQAVTQVNTFSHDQGGNRGAQRFVLYGSAGTKDPGWDVRDRSRFAPIADVDSGKTGASVFVATSIRREDGASLGAYRWLVWAVSPVTQTAGGENTAFQELQILTVPRH